jgi:hypothetical protein
MSEDLNDRIVERMKAPDVPDPKVTYKIAQNIEMLAKTLYPFHQGLLEERRQERREKEKGAKNSGQTKEPQKGPRADSDWSGRALICSPRAARPLSTKVDLPRRRFVN